MMTIYHWEYKWSPIIVERNRELVTFYPSTKLALFSMQLNLIPGLSNLQFLNALYSYFGSIIYVNSLSRSKLFQLQIGTVQVIKGLDQEYLK